MPNARPGGLPIRCALRERYAALTLPVDEDLASPPELGVLLVVDEEASEDFEAVDEDDEDDDDDDDELLDPEPLLEEYRSAYQPPPFRMNIPPELIWRLAVAFPQRGHSVRGASVMRCSTSQQFSQEEQAYS